ncbi:GDP-mannose 4,6-dehydratase [Methyloterricola oryzae]|uniref:GDP-mannose 4,6-dehydratase n=1 Tax=Methyloterricola oryzae TaxID=1495050 RepID=UPI0005EBC2DF|nr:GDP-mannose 4,6-dehydratase [Methyloterricola oryzae]
MSQKITGKRVLVTGAGGFIGSHLTEALVKEGASVKALVTYNSRNDWGQLERLPESIRSQIEVYAGNIRDPYFVDRITKGAEIVFHLAALIPIPYSYLAPAEYVETNVRGTLHVLEACRKNGVARLLHTSTSETYGTALYTPIDEKHPLQGQSPYSASKIGADKLAESYWRSFELPVVIVRPFNTYGPRQSARAFLPTILTQALSGNTVRTGSLEPVRDMNYVGDTVRGFILAATASDVEGLTLNLGSGTGVTMGELMNVAFQILGRSPTVEVESTRLRPRNSEVYELIANADLARKTIGWESLTSLEMGLKKTMEWIAGNMSDYKPQIYNV